MTLVHSVILWGLMAFYVYLVVDLILMPRWRRNRGERR